MGYPLVSTWKYRSIDSLMGGINVQQQPDSIADTQALELNNVLLRAGNICSDTGYDTVGPLVVGFPQLSYQFLRRALTIEQILVTTSTVYKFSSTLYKWMLVKGTAGTTTTSGYVAGNTVIAVASAAGFTTGDLVGVTLDNGDQIQCTITVSGTNFTLAIAVPVGRTISNGAAVIRAVVLSGSQNNQVSACTIPGSDWMVFTNGIDIVKYYDGTQCIDVPNLPSAGNTICASVNLYNEALFLFNTTEGGTNYPGRARRSDQTDPTNWTTGTAGWDDLEDTPDQIWTSEILGPYIIVYKDRTIVRGSFIGSGGLNYFWETMVTTEGAFGTNAVDNITDYHIFVGHAGIYQYRGDYTVTPISQNIFYKMFGASGDLNPQYTNRIALLYAEELNEVWVLYPSSISTNGACDTLLRYNILSGFWYSRSFKDHMYNICLFETSTAAQTWAELIGVWSDQTWQWNSRTSSTALPIIELLGANANQVFEYDYYSQLDNGTPIEYTLVSKDFALVDAEGRFDEIEMYVQGTGILLEYSTDAGVSWHTLATITQIVQDKVSVYAQFIFHRVRFRWSGNDPAFALEWFGFSYKVESLY